MRRGTWILAFSGVMALNNGAIFAADPAPTGRQGAITSTGLPSRYTRAAENKSSAKNYYAELFADPTKPQATEAAPWEGDGSAEKTAAQPAKAADEPAKPAAADVAKPAADARKFAPAARGPKPVPGTTDKVIQAGYDRLPPAAERKLIQQVRSEAPKRTAALPMPDFGVPAEAPATPAAPVAPTAPAANVTAKPAPGKAAATAAAARTPVADTGPQTPQVTIEWVRKGDVNVGQECQLELHVKNSGTTVASQVAVDGIFPSTVRLTGADPKPAASGEKVTWSFDTLAPGAEQTIAIKLIPSRRGDLGATAQVRFTGSASAAFRVEEPLLKVAVKGPAEVMLGDPATQMILVSNPGTGTVHDVKVEARLTDGLEHGSRGERLVMQVGSVAPGETRTVRLGLSAIKGGPQTINVVASSSSEANATSSTQLNVVAPSLKIAVDGPALRYKGRNAKYTLTVTNDGSVPNNNIRISHAVADGFKFVSADRNGKFDQSTKSVQWFIGRMEPGQTAQVVCELNAMTIGDFSHTASVLSDSGIRAEAKSHTKVDGIASLTMDVVDIDDPVEIGAETAYEIRVKNEGSKAATKVSIACELPPEMELKSYKAPVDAIVENRQILFKSLDQVAPGAEVVYRIHVKGIQEGNHRMRVRMTGGSLQEPVVREEATKVYADSK